MDDPTSKLARPAGVDDLKYAKDIWVCDFLCVRAFTFQTLVRALALAEEDGDGYD